MPVKSLFFNKFGPNFAQFSESGCNTLSKFQHDRTKFYKVPTDLFFAISPHSSFIHFSVKMHRSQKVDKLKNFPNSFKTYSIRKPTAKLRFRHREHENRLRNKKVDIC